MQNLKLVTEYQKKGVVYKIIKEAIAIALLPAGKIDEAFGVNTSFPFLFNFFVCIQIFFIAIDS